MTHYPYIDWLLALKQLRRAVLNEVKPVVIPILVFLTKHLTNNRQGGVSDEEVGEDKKTS